MEGLKTLILMQLKDKIDFSYLKSVKKTIFKIVLSILKFVLIVGVIYIGFYVLDYLDLVSTLPGIPQSFFTVVFTLIFSISIVVNIMGLVKNLYFSKDNQLLLTFPVARTSVFTSKLIVYYIYEFLRNINFILPWFVAFGLINGIAFYFYLWLPVVLILLTALSVSISSLLSIPTMYIYLQIKQYKFLEYSLLVLALVAVVTGIVLVIDAIPENFDLIGQWVSTYWKIQNFLNKFIKTFIPFYWVVVACVGKQYGIVINLFAKEQIFCILGIIATIGIVLTITYLLVRPLFFKMASSPFEYKKSKVNKKFANKQMPGFLSFIKKEIVLTYRQSSKFYDLLFVVIGMPLAIFLLNKVFASMDTRLSGVLMGTAFNILLILIISLSSNVSIAHIYSEEGASSYLLKTNPKPYIYSLFAKLVINIVLVSLSLMVTVAIFTSFTSYSLVSKILIYLFLECAYLSHLFMSADLDIMNSQTAQYQTTGSHIYNPNEVKSTIYGFIISILLAVLSYLLIIENMNNVWIKLFVISFAFMALRIWLYINKVKVYFKERQ